MNFILEKLKNIYKIFRSSSFYHNTRNKIIHVLIIIEDIFKNKYSLKNTHKKFKDIAGKIKNFKYEDFKSIKFPTTLYKMLFKSFISWLVVAQTLFVIILLIIDLFFKLNDYINFKVPIMDILSITFMYIPKSISMTIPVAVMFGITMTLGSYYHDNELIAIYTAGISLFKFSIPVIIFSLFLSAGMIFIDANFVIPVERFRTDHYESSIKKIGSGKFDNENITIRGEDNYFWNVGRYISSQNTLVNVIVFKINDEYHVDYRLDAQKAFYGKDGWIFYSGVLREWDQQGIMISETRFQKMQIYFKEKPSIFKKMQYDVENMTIQEASERINFLKKLNIPHNKELTGYYKKFSFPFTLLIISLFAIGVSTISRTNILIISLFFSIGIAILLYVLQLILDVLASTGKIPPFIGAWLTLFLFFPISLMLIKNAKT